MKSYKQTFLIKESASSNEVNGFVILKPEFLNHEEDFLTLLKNNGWDVIQKVKKQLSNDEAKELYKMHKDKDFYNDLCKYMSSGECLCCLCHKNCQDPIKDMDSLKDKVRKTWGKDEMKNGMHSSDSIENVNRESKLIFEKKVIEHWEDYYYQSEGEPIPGPNPECPDSCFDSGKINDLKLKLGEEDYLKLLSMLKDALAEELLAWYHYTITAPFLHGKRRPELVKFFKETAKDEFEDHACWLMERLQQLGSDPNDIADPAALNVIATHKYIIPSYETCQAVMNNITAEKGAIETYTKLEEFTKDRDIVTHSKIEEILKDEQEHLQELEKVYRDMADIVDVCADYAKVEKY